MTEQSVPEGPEAITKVIAGAHQQLFCAFSVVIVSEKLMEELLGPHFKKLTDYSYADTSYMNRQEADTF